MRPSHAEVPGLHEILRPLLSRLVIGHGEREVASELVIDLVAGVHVQRPGSEGVVITCDREVKIIPEHKV